MADKPSAPFINHQHNQAMPPPTSTTSIAGLSLKSNSLPCFSSPLARSSSTMASQTASSPANMTHPPITAATATTAAAAAVTGPATQEMAKKMDITTLMSPPEPILDSFHQDGHTGVNAMATAPGPSSKQPLPMSPPVSPYRKPASHPREPSTTPPAQHVRDPVLYPADDSAALSPSQEPPLFAPSELEEHQKIVDDHLRTRPTDGFGSLEPPTPEQYHLALSFKSNIMRHFEADPKGWFIRQRALLVEADRERRANSNRYPAIMPAKPRRIIAAKPSRAQRVDRVTKPQGGPASGSAAPRTIRVNGAGAGANPNTSKRPASRTSATPEPSRRAVAPNREDKDFNALPDYCPPLNSLPNRPNSLKVEWKGQPLDNSSDQNVWLLHPDEVALASNLRLDCATYLTSKRRIFERRLRCLRTGKEFRKTDAQQACKIDVNKASKLWTAFEKVGWLDAHWVQRFL